MLPNLKKILRALCLEIRHILEGYYNENGRWISGDLEYQLNSLGVWRDRPFKSLDELTYLGTEDKATRSVVDAYIRIHEEAGIKPSDSVAEFVRESAYTWTNRLFSLRCMEARGIIDEVILLKEIYGGRSLVHNRFIRKNPDVSLNQDDGLFEVLFEEFAERARELPALFDPKAPAVAVRPSIAALKRCISLLSGNEAIKGQEAASDILFEAPDTLGWAYQYWNVEEKARIFEAIKNTKGVKIGEADIIPATQLYTEPYMVKFLVQNSLGALWINMNPLSTLSMHLEYYSSSAKNMRIKRKPVAEITFLDPACGSGHFLLEAFNLFYRMYEEEGNFTNPESICAAILNNNLFGIDIDERAVQIAMVALWMQAKEKAPDLNILDMTSFNNHLVATNIHLPKGKNHLKAFLQEHPEDANLRPALETVFEGLENVHELGSLIRIEEPVDKELRYLKDKYEARRDKLEQMALLSEMEPPRQKELPLGVESYGQWKKRILARLRSHFATEAEAADLSQAFFGASVGKGLMLFDLLARRYDIVAANPPYMHCSNFGPNLKSYIYTHYQSASQDLYASFVVRIIELTYQDSIAAIVTQQSFMFLERHLGLREHLFKHTYLDTLIHLGSKAFTEIGGEVVNVVLMTLIKTRDNKQQGYFIDLTAVDDKKASLLQQLTNLGSKAWKKSWSDFEVIPGKPIAYDLDPAMIKLFEHPLLESKAKIPSGMVTGDNSRYVQFWWETKREKTSYMKGGETLGWYGNNLFCIDASREGFVRMRASRTFRAAGAEFYGRQGITYSSVSSLMRARYMEHESIWDCGGPVIIPKEDKDVFWLLALVNSTYATNLLHSINPTINIKTNDVKRLPLCDPICWDKLSNLSQAAVAIASEQDKQLILSKNYSLTFPKSKESCNLASYVSKKIGQKHLNECLLAISQIAIDMIILDAFKIPSHLYSQFQRPVSNLPCIDQYEAKDEIINHVPEFSKEITDACHIREHIAFEKGELSAIRHRLHTLYKAGPKAKIEQDKEEKDGLQKEKKEDDIGLVLVKHIAIPAETFLEELSIKLEIHPISVYWLLKEGREQEGWRCLAEEKNLVLDMFSSIVLQLLGYHWSKGIETEETALPSMDNDGIIPLTSGCGKRTLLECVRDRIIDAFPGGDIASIEREFEEIVGINLANWLFTFFFKRHISQFQSRPIVWQIESKSLSSIANKTHQKNRIENAGPAFSCLVLYHNVNADLLPKLRSQYVGPLRSGYETELRTLEQIENPTIHQNMRKIQLQSWIEELKAFEKKLEEVTRVGFESSKLVDRLAQEAYDQWTSYDGIVVHPTDYNSFLIQESRYDPDLNDGVRINIAPLQKWEVLATDVLVKKDIERAIANRVEWRADERRWCREGKLARPNWWKNGDQQ